MTILAFELASQSIVIGKMTGRSRMALQAQPSIRFIQQAIVVGAVRLMTFRAAAAVDEMIVDYRVLIGEWS